MAKKKTVKEELREVFELAHQFGIETQLPPPVKAAGKGRSRTLILVDKDGKPKRRVTHDRVLEGLMEREEVGGELKGRRPRVVRCVHCRAPRAVKGAIFPIRCEACAKARRAKLQRAYHKANADKEREKQRAYREVNADKVRERQRVYRARKKAESDALAKGAA